MAVKPLLKELEIILTVEDSLEITEKENYIKATATLLDVHSTQCIRTVAYARETNEKKKMDAAQLTGSASSYARKYALNGLLCIDDNQDRTLFLMKKKKVTHSIKSQTTKQNRTF